MAQTTASDALVRPAPGSLTRSSVFIGGTWRPVAEPIGLPVHDSGTGDVIATIPQATRDDLSAALDAARDALGGWAATAPADRARHLRALHAALARRRVELGSVISAEVGTSARMSLALQVDSSLDVLAAAADIVEKFEFEEQLANSTVVQTPIGVVGAITPWNYPLFQSMGKVAGALAAGCTIVHKPSELAPLSAFLLADAVEEAELPPGVYNMVTGDGVELGEMLASDPRVDMVSFTGSTKTGTRVYELAARSIKRVALELGGKSASVILDDADLAGAVKATVNRAFLNSGQTCDAWTKLVVPVDRLEDVVALIAGSIERLTVGDPFAAGTRLGPLVSARQVDRVLGYIRGALAAGAVARFGGADRPPGLTSGNYVQPTVLTGVTPDMPVAREEVFGPVLVVMTYQTEAEATELANGSDYGLSGAVWSADADRALAFARTMRAGQIVINGGGYNPAAPFGGVKRSGIGRELGRYGFEEFLEPVAYQQPAASSNR